MLDCFSSNMICSCCYCSWLLYSYRLVWPWHKQVHGRICEASE